MRIIFLISIVLTSTILNSQDYFSNRLFVKLKEEHKTNYALDKDARLRILLYPSEIVSAKPVSIHPLLNSTFELILDKDVNLDSLILRLNQFSEIDFAEKVPLYKLFFTPNDPLYSSQWNLSKIQADMAWNLSQGCTNVKVAVTDDGFLLTHEDLVNQWHINSGEIAGNGIDDDANGYIDDWRGWDAANNDNDPSATSPTNSYFTHGTHVAGIIAGQTHNSKGIASIGYNCKMIPVKLGLSSNSSLTGAFQGLDYAINASGCDVINMSWGGGGWSATYQTLFNIAKTKGIICVAAAGNSNTSTPMYPASYNHVISVAASASTDSRASFSNYGSTIDVTAPGVGIPSCLAGATNAYGNLSGTSMASPLVAGLCALMKCYNPMPADSIEACLKRTCDNINAQNPSFIGQLGAGRINAFQALQCLTKKPKSDFIALDTFQCIGKSVRYAAKSFGIPTLTYNWSFPGGSPASSAIANPLVTYTTNGYKSATLITCNSLGCDSLTKTNLVNIDTPKASLIGRKYTSYNSNPVLITIKFTGNPPYSVTLTDGTNTWTQSNIKANPYFYSIIPKKDTSLISISTFSDSLCVGNRYGVDTIYRVVKDGKSLCRDSTEVNSAQTGWQALQTNGTWGSLTASSYCAGTFTANSSLFPGVSAANCLWGPIINTGTRTAYNSSSHTSTSTFSGSFPYLRKQFALPTGSVIDSVRLWMISDDYIDSVWVNNKVVYKATNPIHYGQILMNGSDLNLGNTISPLNEVIVKPGDFGGCNGTYFRMKVYFRKDCNNVSCKDSTIFYTDTSNWYYQNTSGNWVKATLGINTCGQSTHAWSPINLIGIQNANQMIWGSTASATCNVKREINIPNVSIIDSIRVLVQADDNIVSFKVNGTHVTSTPFGWNNVSSVLINKSLLINGVNAFTIEGTNANGSCAWVAMKMILYKDSCKTTSQDCDTSGLVLCMSMDGNANDSSKFAHNGVVRGATLTTGRNGTSNSAYYFDGTTSHISLGVKPMLKPNAASISVWVKPHVFNSYTGGNANCIFLTKNPNNPGSYMEAYSLYMTNRSGPIKFMTVSTHQPTTNEKWFQSNQNTVLNQWTHLVLTFDTDSLKLYINGQLDNKVYKGFTNVYDALDSIMLGYSANTTNKNYFKGDMDELKIYNRVLSAIEVQNLYTKPFTCTCSSTPPPSDCDTTYLNTGKVLHLDFNGNTQDKSGLGNHAANYGATAAPGKDGVGNTAYKFNGSSDYMEIINSTSLNPLNGASFTAIIKLDAHNTSPLWYASNIFSKSADGINGSYYFRITNSTSTIPDTNVNVFWFGHYQNGYDYNAYISTLDASLKIKTNNWYCVVYTYDKDTCKMFVNGILQWKYKAAYNSWLTSTGNLRIGRSLNTFPGPDQYFFNGVVDDIRIYNRALSPSEVKGYCGTCNVTPPPTDCDTTNLNTGKVLHLDFNGNTQDKSGNSNHATNYGATPTPGKNGVGNTAYKFNGTSHYMEVANSSIINAISNKISLTAILKVDAFNTNPGWYASDIIAKGSGSNAGSYNLGLVNGVFNSADTLKSNFDFHFYNTGYNFPNNSSSFKNPPFVLPIKWYCIVATFDGDSIKVYYDGNLRLNYKAHANSIPFSNSGLKIGKSFNSPFPDFHFFNGVIDDIRIYNRVLAPSEVKGYCGTCNVTQPPPCDTAQKFTFTQCHNDSIQLLARTGSKYQWSPVSGLTNDTIRNPKVFVSNNQRYLVSYTSAKNCQLIDTVDIEVKSAAIYPKMDDQLICIGDSVQMTIPIYATNIVWSPNLSISATTSKNPFFFPTTNRTYYLEFRDTFGCLQRDTFVVNTKVCCPARARFSIPKDLLCFGETLPITNTSKGLITSYNWSFGAAVPNTFTGANPPILTFPIGGSYTLRLIVTNGSCFDTMIKAVNVVHIIPNAGRDTTNCLGAFVTNLGESPISDWTYKWTPIKYLDDPSIANPKCSIINDSVNYVLEIVDRNSGCKAYDTVVVYTNRKIDSTVQNSRICGGDSVLFNGVQRKTSGNYYYTIKKADGFCDSFIDLLRLDVLQKQIIKHIDTGACDIYIDKKGRKFTDSFTEYDTIRSKTLIHCDSIITFRKIKILKKIYKERTLTGCAPLRYNGKTYLVTKMKVDSIRTRGAYYGCDSIIEYINVIVYPKPKAEITPSIPNPVMYKQTVTLKASGGQTYLWLQTGSTNSEIDYKINNTQPKLYTVRVTDENDCWDTISYKIIGKLPDTCFYGFPNVFSPNQDNLNDEYIPNMDECTEIKVFAIYDRWGEKVFETNQQKGWNGSYKGKPAPMAVYLYYAEMITPWGIKIHKGTFTLIR